MALDTTALIFALKALKNGGGGGTSDYNALSNKPKVNSNVLTGDKSSLDLGIYDIPSGNTLPTGEVEGQWFFLLQTYGNIEKGLYRWDGTTWVLELKLDDTIIIEASSHTDIEGYAVPVLTQEQVHNAYNGVIAGKNVFVVDDMDFITIQVLDASNIIHDNISIRLLFTDKMILTYYEDGTIEHTNLEKNYLSLRRLDNYLYEITFDKIPEYKELNVVPFGNCSSFIKGGKLYRNLDWQYNENAEFRVITKDFEGMAFLPNLNDSSLEDSKLEQLPYHINDGVNRNGIMVSSHILFNDFSYEGSGTKTNDITLLPYFILTNLHSINLIEDVLDDYLANLKIPTSLSSIEYLMQYVVSNGSISYVITPKVDGSGYEIVNIDANPKLTNFKWTSEKTVERTDLQNRPVGVERWNLIDNLTDGLKELRYTRCYEDPIWLSEFIGESGTTKESTDEELLALYNVAHSKYLTRTRNGELWQTVHSVIYNPNGMESLCVQENFDKDFITINDKLDEITITRNQYGKLEVKDLGLDATKIKNNAIGSGLKKDGIIIKHSNSTTPITEPTSIALLKYDSEGHITGSIDAETKDLFLSNQSRESYSGLARMQNEVNEELVERIKFIESKPDVVDIVQCYDRGTDTTKTDIVHYDLSSILINDIVKVLIDETHDDKVSYYKYVEPTTFWKRLLRRITNEAQFVYIGSDKPVGVDDITIDKDTNGNLEVKDQAITNDKINDSLRATEIREESSAVDTQFPTEKAVATAIKNKIGFKLFSSGQTRDTVFNTITTNNTQLNGIASFTNAESPDSSVYSFYLEIVRGSSASNGFIIAQKINSTEIYKTSKSTTGWTTWQQIVAVDNTSISKNSNGQLEVNTIKRAMWDEAYSKRAYNTTGQTYATREALLLASVNGSSFNLTRFTTASENPNGVSSSQLWDIVIHKEDSYNCQMIAYKPGSDEVYKCYRTNSGWEHWIKQSNGAKFIELSGESGTLTSDQLSIIKENNDNYIIFEANGYAMHFIGGNDEHKLYAIIIMEDTGEEGQANAHQLICEVVLSTGAYTVAANSITSSGYQDAMKGEIASGNTGFITGEDVYDNAITKEITLSGSSGTLTSAQLTQIKNHPYNTVIILSSYRYKCNYISTSTMYFQRNITTSSAYIAITLSSGAWTYTSYSLENSANKETSLTESSTTRYPSSSAVSNFIRGLLAIGSYGGGKTGITDCNEMNKAGFYYVGASLTNGPAGYTWGNVLVTGGYSTSSVNYYFTQIFTYPQVTTSDNTAIWVRHFYNGSYWTEWKKIVDDNMAVPFIKGRQSGVTRDNLYNLATKDEAWTFFGPVTFNSTEGPDYSTQWMSALIHKFSSWAVLIAVDRSTGKIWTTTKSGTSWTNWKQLALDSEKVDFDMINRADTLKNLCSIVTTNFQETVISQVKITDLPFDGTNKCEITIWRYSSNYFAVRGMDYKGRIFTNYTTNGGTDWNGWKPLIPVFKTSGLTFTPISDYVAFSSVNYEEVEFGDYYQYNIAMYINATNQTVQNSEKKVGTITGMKGNAASRYFAISAIYLSNWDATVKRPNALLYEAGSAGASSVSVYFDCMPKAITNGYVQFSFIRRK